MPLKKKNKEKRSSSIKKGKEVPKKNISSESTEDGSENVSAGPSIVPYNQKFIDKEYKDYKAFYEDFSRPPINRKDDKVDAFRLSKKAEVPFQKEYFTGWEVKNTKTGSVTFQENKPKEKPWIEANMVQNKPVGEYQDLRELNRRVSSYAQNDAIAAERPNFLKTEAPKNKKKVNRASYGEYRKLGTRKQK